MKKFIISIFTVVSLFFVQPLSMFAAAPEIDWDRLGAYIDLEYDGISYWDGIIFETTIYFQHGSITKYTLNGETITTVAYDLNGDEDRGKISTDANDDTINNLDQNKYVYIYQANEIGNLNPVERIEIKGKSEIKVHNLNFNFEHGKPYIIVVQDNKGKALEMNKIMISE